jgi:PIN domain nuclease of toxin-antitoxin system
VEVTASAPSSFLMAVKLANVTKDQLDQKFAALGVKARTGVDIYIVFIIASPI